MNQEERPRNFYSMGKSMHYQIQNISFATCTWRKLVFSVTIHVLKTATPLSGNLTITFIVKSDYRQCKPHYSIKPNATVVNLKIYFHTEI